MKIQLNKLAPTPTEFGLFGFLAVILSLLGNSSQLLNNYGLAPSAQTISTTAGGTLSEGLAKLDTYQATTSIVTFAVWAIIGLFTLSIIQALLRISQEFSLEQKVSSNAYVHPSGFSRASFWRQVVLQSIGGFLVLMMCALYVVTFCLYVLPVGLLYTREPLLHFSLNAAGYGLLGLAVLFVGLCLLDVVGRLLRFRHTLVKS